MVEWWGEERGGVEKVQYIVVEEKRRKKIEITSGIKNRADEGRKDKMKMEEKICRGSEY